MSAISMHYASNVNKTTNYTNNELMNPNGKSTIIYPTTIESAVKMLNYKNIAPAPAAPLPLPAAALQSAATSETTEYAKPIATAAIDVGVKNRKYTPRVTTNTPPYNVDQTQSVQRRNARERNRVKQVNNSFARLRQHLPQYIVSDMTKGGGRGPHKKISKVDTLRIAVEYIRRLEYLVEDLSGSDCLSTSSESINDAVATSSTTIVNQSQVYYTNSTLSSQTEFQQQTLPLPQQQQQQQQQHNPQQQQQQQQNPQFLQHQSYANTLLTPVSLSAFSPIHTKIDMSCASPTSSFISNTSFDSGTYEPAHQLSPEPFNDALVGDIATTTNHSNNLNNNNKTNLALKFEPYDNFRLDEEDCTPDDDDIIDYISLWQEEQATHN